MLHDITIGGYTFGSDGAWINEQIQSQRISVLYPYNWNKSSLNGKEFYYLDNKGTCVTLDMNNIMLN